MKEGINKGIFFCTFGDEFILVWNNRQYMKSIFIDLANNLPILQYKGTNDDVVQYFTDQSAPCLDCNCFMNTSTMLPVESNVVPSIDDN